MAELPNLIKDLALILVVAGVVTLVFKRLKQPLVLGYIVAGFVVSPHMPYTMSVVDKGDIHTWADIGVTFLLFALGLEFSVKKILKMGMAPVIAAVSIIFFMLMMGMGVAGAFGWDRMDCIFLGGMVAMSSTTIIYKAFDDMGLLQQSFARLVMSVLILEDILAIVMMVMLSAIASGSNPDGGQMLGSLVRIGFFLVLWFVVGLYVVPTFLRATRKLMTDETLVIVALGLCCAMAWISTAVGFSSAFGAFVMGSILAETIEVERIEEVVAPVKNLFGAIFFVSVGMLVDPHVLVAYAAPIGVLVVTILLGQAVLGTFSYMLSGQPLRTAMRCGFSMAQVGEFAFIIASLGRSLHVISDFLYPVIVAVSVITTFLTPYMIRTAEPTYSLLEHHLPHRWRRRLEHMGVAHQSTNAEQSLWRRLFKKMGVNTLIYTILCIAVTAVMLTFVLQFMRHLLPHWWANGVTGVLTVLCLSPFMRALVMKNNHSEEFRTLWTESRLNRLPLLFTILVRSAIATAILFYICNYLARFATAIVITLAVVAIVLMVMSRNLKRQSITMERRFVQNLRSRDIAEQVSGKRRPLFEGKLIDRDIHIGSFDIPKDSQWAGQTLANLRFSSRFGVHVSSVLRGRQRINIPGGDAIIFPGDRLQVIGNDEQLQAFGQSLKGELVPEDPHIEEREMKLQKMKLSANCPFIGKSLSESGIRDVYNCMLVGLEDGQHDLTMINPSRQFKQGDIIWIVGERKSIADLVATN